jgi:hypothetical protein
MAVQPARLRGIVARWRRAGYAQTGTLGPGPAWCWLTAAAMSACGLGYPARPPALSRLAHIRAVLAARLWLESGPSAPPSPTPHPGLSQRCLPTPNRRR